MFSSINDLLREAGRDLQVRDGQVRIRDLRRFREDLLDRLVYTAVFGDEQTKATARWLVWKAAPEAGVLPASIDELYQARGRDEYQGLTVPAINIRGMTYDVARAVVRTARRMNGLAVIFEIARSEMGYTFQRPEEYATVVLAAAIREGHDGPLFIQGDHFQANAKRYAQDPEREIGALVDLCKEAVDAGFYNIDIDTSTLVDLSLPSVDEQQRVNYVRCAELAAYIREIEPEGVTISTGGEIGEVGKKNSTVEELRAFLEGFRHEFRRRRGEERGLSKVSVQTGTSHGGVVLPDGTIAQVRIDFKVLRDLSEVAREYGLAGAVQHGASTLPLEAFDKFPEQGTAEVHLATEFQNIILDGGLFPEDLKREMYDYIKREFADEWTPGETEQQFIYKTRKKAWGPFKRQVWDLPQETRSAIAAQLEQRFEIIFDKLGVRDSRQLVLDKVHPVVISKPVPAGLARELAGVGP